MENSKFNNLQNLLTFKNIDFLKESFVSEKLENEEKPFYLNEEFGILQYYYDNDVNFIELNFENNLKKLLFKEVVEIKNEIDSTLIFSDSIKRKKFIDYIKKTIKFIEVNEIELLQKFPVCKIPLVEITAYLKVKYDIDLQNAEVEKSEESLFKIKHGIKSSTLKKLYDITLGYYVVDDEQISQEAFLSVLLDKETSEKIIFNCKNGLTMNYLQTISTWFDNFTGKSIEDSQRFYTKGGKTLITETNYNKAKKDISEKDGKTLAAFTKEFVSLIKN